MPQVEAVTTEIIKGKLLATADEMGIVLARTSMSPVIYEVLDFACGVTDARGQLVAQTNGITVFTGTFGLQVQSMLRKFAGQIAPGDVYMTNDPYGGGTHTADIALIKPIFWDNHLTAFGIAVAHWSEVGGKVAGSLSPDAVEIYQEGVQFPGIRVCVGDVVAQDVVDLIAANVRLPKNSLGDLNAELAAVRICEFRLHEICRRYGRDRLLGTFGAILEQGEHLARQAMRMIPNGVYAAEDFIDGDGMRDERLPIQVMVTVEDESMRVDFTGCAPQSPGPINCTASATLSSCKTIFKAITEPTAPSNDGWFQPLTVTVPPGTVFSAVRPAPVGWYYESSTFVSELVWKALAPVAPNRLTAGSYASLCATYLYGRDPETRELFVHIEPHNGGWGAGVDKDGESGLVATPDGDTYNYPVELVENKFPLRVERYELNVEDGSGAGRFRGGYGLIRVYEVLGMDTVCYASLGRSIEPPWGVAGGHQGTVNYLEIVSGRHRRRGARFPHTTLRRGDHVRIVTGGGGGYGPPEERDVGLVQRDARDGLISREQALALYGVILREDNSVDIEATRAERARRTGLSRLPEREVGA